MIHHLVCFISYGILVLQQIIFVVAIAAHTFFEILVWHLTSDIIFIIYGNYIPRRKQYLEAPPFTSFSF